MSRWLTDFWHSFRGWHQSALNHAAIIRRSRTLPVWLALIGVSLDFVLVGAWFRCTRELSVEAWAVSDAILYLARLAVVTGILLWACRHYQVAGEALGIRPVNLRSDLRWSIKCCLLGASIVGATLATGFAAACWLGVRPPAPPAFVVDLLSNSHWNARHVFTLSGLGATGVLLAPFTEELIYRSLLLPTLTSRLGLYPATAMTAIVFGLVHVIPFGVVGIPAPQILGGLMMAAAFSIRWSVIPAMVLHALGNLFVGILCFVYVRLYEAFPTLFRLNPA